MGFWIFMFIMNLLVPFTMIGFGNYFFKKVPKEINVVFGYRTAMSMKNKETWEFAHHYVGKLWRIVGWIVLVISIIAMFFVINKDIKMIGIFGGILTGVQCIFIILPIFPTEAALKKNFDMNGNRRV